MRNRYNPELLKDHILLYSEAMITSMHRLLMTRLEKHFVAASTLEKDVKSELKKTNDVEAAAYVGKLIAKKAIEKNIKDVVLTEAAFISWKD